MENIREWQFYKVWSDLEEVVRELVPTNGDADPDVCEALDDMLRATLEEIREVFPAIS